MTLEMLYSLLIDVVAVFVGLFIVFRAYKMGFLRSVVLLIGYVASIIAALYLSNIIASYLYDNFIRVAIIENINQTMTAVTEGTITAAVPLILEMLPAFLSGTVLSSLGGQENVIKILEEQTGGIVENLGIAVADFVVQPIVYSLLQAVICLLIFIFCVIIVKIIAKIFKGFYAIPILGTLNCILGGILGIVQAGVYLLLFGLLADAVVALTSNSLSWFNDGILNSTIVFKYFYQFFGT